MKIDLRYVIPVVAFFVPTPIISLFAWYWGAEITDPVAGMTGSIVLGIATLLVVGMFMSERRPIIYHIGKQSETPPTGRGE